MGNLCDPVARCKSKNHLEDILSSNLDIEAEKSLQATTRIKNDPIVFEFEEEIT